MERFGIDGRDMNTDANQIQASGGPVRLSLGLHNLEFRFGMPEDISEQPVRFRCRLKGLDTEWREQGGSGMRLWIFKFLFLGLLPTSFSLDIDPAGSMVQ